MIGILRAYGGRLYVAGSCVRQSVQRGAGRSGTGARSSTSMAGARNAKHCGAVVESNQDLVERHPSWPRVRALVGACDDRLILLSSTA